MDPATDRLGRLTATSRQLAGRLLTIGENRLELLAVEWQEERARLLHALLLALGVGAFGLLAGLTLTAALVLGLRCYSPVSVLLVLSVLYGATGFCLHRRLAGLLRDWRALSATLEELRKDRACLQEFLS